MKKDVALVVTAIVFYLFTVLFVCPLIHKYENRTAEAARYRSELTDLRIKHDDLARRASMLEDKLVEAYVDTRLFSGKSEAACEAIAIKSLNNLGGAL